MDSIVNKNDCAIITTHILEIRKKLAEQYDVRQGEHYRYRGLCDISFDMLREDEISLSSQLGNQVKITEIHGEQQHTPRIRSENWVYQHTWAKIETGRGTYYVDPTSSQFSDLYKDIPPYYVSTKPPKWYYPDRKNPALSKIGYKIDTTIKIITGNRKIGLIQFFQYSVWGSISNVIHNIFFRKDN